MRPMKAGSFGVLPRGSHVNPTVGALECYGCLLVASCCITELHVVPFMVIPVDRSGFLVLAPL